MVDRPAPGGGLRLDRRDVIAAARRTRVVLLATVMLVGVTLAACGGDGDDDMAGGDGAAETQTETTDTSATETTTTETAPDEGGAAAAGRRVFLDTGCGSCHTLAAAGTDGTTGPNLDETLLGETPQQIRTSIVDPNADITEGYGPGVMPQDFQEQLDEQELNALVDFLAANAGR